MSTLALLLGLLLGAGSPPAAHAAPPAADAAAMQEADSLCVTLKNRSSSSVTITPIYNRQQLDVFLNIRPHKTRFFYVPIHDEDGVLTLRVAPLGENPYSLHREIVEKGEEVTVHLYDQADRSYAYTRSYCPGHEKEDTSG